MNIIPKFFRRRISHRPNLIKIADNLSWLFVDKILRMTLNTLLIAWIARYLGPEQFGTLNYATAIIGLIGVFSGLGFNSTVVRDLILSSSNKEETLGTAALLQFLAGLLTYGLLLASTFGLSTETAVTKKLVAIIGSVIIFKASDIAIYWFESQLKSKYVVLVRNIIFLIFSVIKIQLIIFQAPLVAFAWSIVAESFTTSVALLLTLSRFGINIIQLRIRFIRAKEMLKDSLPLLLSGVMITTYMKIDQVMLGQMRGEEAVGIYSAAAQISEIWYFIPIAVVASISPALLEAKNKNKEIYYKITQKVFDMMSIISILIALPISLFSKPISNLIFGEAYIEAGSVLSIHVWTSIFVFLGVASTQWLLAEGKQIIILQRTSLGAAINILLNFIFIPNLGATGAAIATLISHFLVDFAFDYFSKETRHIFLMKIKSMNIPKAFERVTGQDG